MKRILLILFCAALLLSAPACGSVKTDSGKPTVVCTIFPQYDFVRQIAGDRVNLIMLCKPGSEIHGFDPSLAEMTTILNADLLIYVGGETDRWVSELLEKSDRDIRAVALVDLCDTVDEEHVLGMQGEAEDEPEADEHVWTSLPNAIRIIEGLTETLSEMLPDEADAMRDNAAAYTKELSALDEEYRAVMEHAQRRTVVFAERFPFRYLCEELGLSYYAALPGCSSNEEVAPSTLAFLIRRVREEQIPGVFYIEFSDERIADAIRASTGCETWLLHSCHNVSRADFEAGVTYLDLMRANLESIKKAVE